MLLPGSEARPEVCVAIVDEACSVPGVPNIRVRDDVLVAVLRAMTYVLGNGPGGRLTVGVDPGKRIGVAALYEGRVFDTATLTDPDAVVTWIERVIRSVSPSSVVVKIGAGAPDRRDELLRRMRRVRNAVVKLVDESGSTRRTAHNVLAGSRDEASAVYIARTERRVSARNTRRSCSD